MKLVSGIGVADTGLVCFESHKTLTNLLKLCVTQHNCSDNKTHIRSRRESAKANTKYLIFYLMQPFIFQ